ncbi:MAG: TPM domain-containing protein [Lacunisphaera sp.]
MNRALLCLVIGIFLTSAGVAEVMPPVPEQYFNDYAKAVPAPVAANLNATLQNFEEQTSDQVVVAVFPKMESDSSISDYAQRLAERWKLGRKGKNNGVVLFVFIQNRTMDIEVGYGLEGALPDVLAKRIIDEEIKPHFRTGDYAGGLNAGVTAIMQAVRGEFKGNGTIQNDISSPTGWSGWSIVLLFIAFPVISFLSYFFRRNTTVYHSKGQRTNWGSFWGGMIMGTLLGGMGGGGGGGGGFSGGGGGFGGGGASGGW